MISRRRIASWTCALLSLGISAVVSANAATLHVWQDSPIPTPPFTNWDTAAHIIQDAVDAAGEEVICPTEATAMRNLVTQVPASGELAPLQQRGPFRTEAGGSVAGTGREVRKTAWLWINVKGY